MQVINGVFFSGRVIKPAVEEVALEITFTQNDPEVKMFIETLSRGSLTVKFYYVGPQSPSGRVVSRSGCA